MKTKEILEQYTNISLRKLSAALGVNYQMLLKIQKKPVEGQVYEPTAINFEALDAYIASRVDESIIEAVDFETLNNNGMTIAAVGFDDYNLNDKVTCRGAEAVWQIVYKTGDHLCIQMHGSTKLRSMNAHTFIHQSPKKVEDVK